MRWPNETQRTLLPRTNRHEIVRLWLLSRVASGNLIAVSEGSVTAKETSKPRMKAADGREEGIARRGTGGTSPKVTDTDLAKVEKARRKGPLAHGYPTELWTLARVSEVIEAVTGVKYHPGHVWPLLRQMGWSRQRPARQATEHHNAAIEQWVNERWPKIIIRPGQGGLDRLPRRERGQPPPCSALDLSTEGRDPGLAPPPRQLETPGDVGRSVLFPRYHRRLHHGVPPRDAPSSGTAFPRTAAGPWCAPFSISDNGWWSNGCHPMPMASTRSSRYGPIFAPTPSPRRPRSSTKGFVRSAARPGCASPSSDIAASGYEHVPRGITRRSLGRGRGRNRSGRAFYASCTATRLWVFQARA